MGSTGMISPIRFRWAGRAYQVSQHRVDGPVERWRGVLRAFMLAPKLEVATNVKEFAQTLTE